jgi:GTP pyrophosphokinase
MSKTSTKTQRYADALSYATAAHLGQVRKGTDIPYISHPVAVAELVEKFGGDGDQVIAALLHDVVEDCGVSFTEIAERFGGRVAAIVEGCTDAIPDESGRKPDWRMRKELYIEHLSTAPADTILVSACDKLHNARCIRDDRATVGPTVFDRFTAGYDGTKWYYHALLEIFERRLGETTPVVSALREALAKTY